MLGNYGVGQGTKSVLCKDCLFCQCTIRKYISVVSMDLKLSHKRLRKKWKVFKILGRVLLWIVVTKLSLKEYI